MTVHSFPIGRCREALEDEMAESTRFTREALYELIWTEPISRIASG